MENAVDALKIAFAVFVFAIAVALTFSIVGQARATSDTILALNDKTNLYEYVDSSENNAGDKDRIVGFETILPTIYRYVKEQYAVTILKNDGTPIVRFDTYTEGFMGNWDNTLKFYRANINDPNNRYVIQVKELQNRISLVDDVIKPETGKENAIWSSLVNTFNYPGELYEGKNEANNGITTVAPWIGNDKDVIDRIKADLSGDDYIKTINSISVKYYSKKLGKYKDRKFKEKFIEIQTSGTTITEIDETDQSIEYSLETVKGNKTLEIIYILQD